MFGSKTLDRLEKMLESAISGDFTEADYDETKLSRLETKWKQFLGASQLSRESLEREKENVKSLVTDISHQTKTPITNMKLYVSLLQENLEEEEPEKEQYAETPDEQDVYLKKKRQREQREQNLKLLQEIQKQTDKLEFMIQSLTKVSRLESNIVVVQPKTQEVSPLLEGAVRMVLPKAEKKKIEIVVSDQPGCSASFDFKWTKEALENILDNAVKYSECGGTVTVSVLKYEMYTAISVKDEGIGIGEEDIPKIFERFYRAQEVQQKEGVGIGLYLAREILGKENGYIKVKSEKGRGTEFILYLWKKVS